MRHAITKAMHRAKTAAHKVGHVAHHVGHDGAHVIYFAAAFAEGHGLYSIMGGILCGMGSLHLGRTIYVLFFTSEVPGDG